MNTLSAAAIVVPVFLDHRLEHVEPRSPRYERVVVSLDKPRRLQLRKMDVIQLDPERFIVLLVVKDIVRNVNCAAPSRVEFTQRRYHPPPMNVRQRVEGLVDPALGKLA